MGLALVLIFLVLAAQFNSFRDPFVILAGSVPLAMFGALIFTFLKFAGPRACTSSSPRAGRRRSTSTRRSAWSRSSGLVSKNGILIVEFANAQQRRGISKIQRRPRGRPVRLRPILMTTVATVGGHFPLTLVTGAGAAARNSIGIALSAA